MYRPRSTRCYGALLLQPAEEAIENGLAVFFIDGLSEWNIHRTNLHTVLRVATVGDAIVTHNPLQSFLAIHGAAGMHIKESHLGDRLWTDVMIFVVLRTGFQTTAAGHTARVGVALHHIVLVHAWAGAKIVGAVQFDPGVHSLQMIEHL